MSGPLNYCNLHKTSVKIIHKIVVNHRLKHILCYDQEFNQKNNMDIKLVHVPKFNCELNPIEMYWANLKCFFRKKSTFFYRILP